MTQEKSANKSVNRAKPFLMILAFVVTLFLLLGGIVTASNWYKIRPYKALAVELNETLGGGYTTSYKWNCSLETTNCPSALMFKNIDSSTETQIRSKLEELKSKLSQERYQFNSIGECNKIENYSYCRAVFKDTKSGLIITISPRQESIFVDIEP